jgi:hypothetical protein
MTKSFKEGHDMGWLHKGHDKSYKEGHDTGQGALKHDK